MVRRIGIPQAVRSARLASLERHLERTPSARIAVRSDLWWAELAAATGIDTSADLVESGGRPDGEMGLVLVDVLRNHLADAIGAARRLRRDERMVFSEIDHADGSRLDGLLRHIDTTGMLWANGFSVIDVDRIPVRTPAGVWHVVTGVARPTPPVATS